MLYFLLVSKKVLNFIYIRSFKVLKKSLNFISVIEYEPCKREKEKERGPTAILCSPTNTSKIFIDVQKSNTVQLKKSKKNQL